MLDFPIVDAFVCDPFNDIINVVLPSVEVGRTGKQNLGVVDS